MPRAVPWWPSPALPKVRAGGAKYLASHVQADLLIRVAKCITSGHGPWVPLRQNGGGTEWHVANVTECACCGHRRAQLPTCMC